MVRLDLPDHTDGLHHFCSCFRRRAEHDVGPDLDAVFFADGSRLQIFLDRSFFLEQIENALAPAFESDHSPCQSGLGHLLDDVRIPAHQIGPHLTDIGLREARSLILDTEFTAPAVIDEKQIVMRHPTIELETTFQISQLADHVFLAPHLDSIAEYGPFGRLTKVAFERAASSGIGRDKRCRHTRHHRRGQFAAHIEEVAVHPGDLV